MIGIETTAKNGSLVIVTRTREEQIGRVAPCCKRPHLRGGFVVGDRHAECTCYERFYTEATTLIIERERAEGAEFRGREPSIAPSTSDAAMLAGFSGPSRR